MSCFSTSYLHKCVYWIDYSGDMLHPPCYGNVAYIGRLHWGKLWTKKDIFRLVIAILIKFPHFVDKNIANDNLVKTPRKYVNLQGL